MLLSSQASILHCQACFLCPLSSHAVLFKIHFIVFTLGLFLCVLYLLQRVHLSSVGTEKSPLGHLQMVLGLR